MCGVGVGGVKGRGEESGGVAAVTCTGRQSVGSNGSSYEWSSILSPRSERGVHWYSLK